MPTDNPAEVCRKLHDDLIFAVPLNREIYGDIQRQSKGLFASDGEKYFTVSPVSREEVLAVFDKNLQTVADIK